MTYGRAGSSPAFGTKYPIKYRYSRGLESSGYLHTVGMELAELLNHRSRNKDLDLTPEKS